MRKEIIVNRDMLESLIISCCYKDITLLSDVNEDFFNNEKCYFYYKLLKEMCRNAKEINELSVISWVNTNNLHDLFNEYGGYESIVNLMNMNSSVLNFDSYLDSLKKILVLESYTHLEIDFDKDFEIENKKINPIDSMPYLNGEEFSNLLQNIVIGKALKVQTDEYKSEQLFYTEEEIYDQVNNIKSDGSSFDVTLRFVDDNGDDRFIQSFKLLNDILSGLHSGNGTVTSSL